MNARITSRLIVVSVLLLCAISTSAQRWNARRYELHVGLGLTNFMGDVCSPKNSDLPVWVVPFRTTGYVADGILKYNIKGRHYGSASLNLGYMGARETIEKRTNYYYRDGIAFKSGFAELAARYEFMFIKEKTHRTVYRKLGETRFKNFTMPSYLFVGAGGYFSYGKFYWNDKKGRERFNENFFNVSPVLMGGFGGKVRIGWNLYAGFEAGWRVAIGDGIDNCDGKKGSPVEDMNWVFGKWIDQYQFVTANIVFKMREKRNHMPNFKTIRR